MPVYQYAIPLNETEDGSKPVYKYPEEEVCREYKQDGKLIIIREEVIPQFHKDSMRVGVDVLTEDEVGCE